MSLADMNVQVFSTAHGGRGSGCCCFCDKDLIVKVRFDDGTVAEARHFEQSKLGKGFAKASVRFAGRKSWTRTVITPRDSISR